MKIIYITIQSPDEVIPFNDLIATLPTFECKKPAMIGDLKVGFLDDNANPQMTSITSKRTTVVDYDDLKNFMEQLNRYIGYVEHHLNERTPKRILLQLVSTKKGRQLVEDMLSNSKFHPEMNEKVHWTRYIIPKFLRGKK